MKTNKVKQLVAGVGGVSALVLVGAGVFSVPQANARIANTKHNLGASQSATGANRFTATGEICVFCHTPHGSDTSASVPLWNRTLSAPSTYTTYNSLGTSSLDGATAPVGSVSLACLSCHDGTQAMNTVLNAPGSGSAWSTTGAWEGTNQDAGKLKAGIIANLSPDLKNDHPIGIQYGGGPTGPIPATGDYTTFKDKDFKPAKSTSANGMTVWWVETGGTGRQKTDMQLYTRSGPTVLGDGSASTGNQPYVECASCHDPHTAAAPTFLRVSNSGSAVCLACHDK